MGGLNQAWHQLSLDFSLQFHDGRYISSTAAKRKYKYKYKYNCKYKVQLESPNANKYPFSIPLRHSCSLMLITTETCKLHLIYKFDKLEIASFWIELKFCFREAVITILTLGMMIIVTLVSNTNILLSL